MDQSKGGTMTLSEAITKNEEPMNFGKAIECLKEGCMVARKGWNGKGMFIFMTVGNTVSEESIPNFKSIPDQVKYFLEKRGTDVVFNPSITMLTATGELQPGWLASQTDMLAEDWVLV